MSLVDVSELMDDPEFSRPFTLRRPTGTFDDTGLFNANYKILELVGIIQPAGPEVAKILPEGTRIDNVRSVWCADKVTAGDGKVAEADILVIDGLFFRVIKCEPWDGNGYWRVYAEGFVP